MGRLIVSVLTSLDGYYEGPTGGVSGLPFEDAFNTHNLELLRTASTLVYGSTWFAANWTHWSSLLTDTSTGERDREIAALVTTLPSVVISDSLPHDAAQPWAATTQVVPRAQAPALLARLKAADDNLLIFGSARTWNPLLQAGLVDEVVVLVGAAFAGAGSKVYAGPAQDLHLMAADVLPGSQLVRLRYAPVIKPEPTVEQ